MIQKIALGAFIGVVMLCSGVSGAWADDGDFGSEDGAAVASANGSAAPPDDLPPPKCVCPITDVKSPAVLLDPCKDCKTKGRCQPPAGCATFGATPEREAACEWREFKKCKCPVDETKLQGFISTEIKCSNVSSVYQCTDSNRR